MLDTTLVMESTHQLDDRNYLEMIVPYVDALQNMMSRIETLSKDFARKDHEDPIHHIQNRIKTRDSIEEKLVRRNYEPTVENAKDHLMDIAGIRIIFHFSHDIERFVNVIKRQEDLIILKECDYITNPKPNGYRSYHIVFGVPVYHTDGMDYYPVEIQLRTMSMDFWASMEHRICYKRTQKNPAEQQMLLEEFQDFAQELEEIEKKMEKYCQDN